MIAQDVKPCDLVDKCLSAWRHIPQDRHLHSHFYKKLRYFALFCPPLSLSSSCNLHFRVLFRYLFLSFSILISVLEECLISSGSFILCGIYKCLLCILHRPLCCLPISLRCFSPELPQPVAYLCWRSCQCSTAICFCINVTRMLRL
jgi:hypothetical protein